MFLDEQFYKNLNREYFHGARTGKLDEKDKVYSNCLYLTPSFLYAAAYACSEDYNVGKVFKYQFKKPLNIFNAHCKTDVLKLKAYLNTHANIKVNPDWCHKDFENEDWCYIFQGPFEKDTFIECIRDCKYDGFFNFEWSDNAKALLDITIGDEIKNKPAIGIFSLNNIQYVRGFNYFEFLQFPDFKKAYDTQLNNLRNFAVALDRNEIENLENFVFNFVKEKCNLLNVDVVYETIKHVEYFQEHVDYEPNLYNLGYFEECLKYGKSKRKVYSWHLKLDEKYILRKS